MKIINILITFFCSVNLSCGSSQQLLPHKAEAKVYVQHLQQKFSIFFNNASFGTKTIEQAFEIYDQQYSKVKTNGNKIAHDRAADCLRVKNADYIAWPSLN